MKKKLLIIIGIIVVVIVAGLCIYYFCIKGDNIDNKKLEEDKKAITENGNIINSNLKDNKYGAKEIYEGDGYTIEVYHGEKEIEYIIYSNGKKIWEYKKTIPEEKANN